MNGVEVIAFVLSRPTSSPLPPPPALPHFPLHSFSLLPTPAFLPTSDTLPTPVFLPTPVPPSPHLLPSPHLSRPPHLSHPSCPKSLYPHSSPIFSHSPHPFLLSLIFFNLFSRSHFSFSLSPPVFSSAPFFVELPSFFFFSVMYFPVFLASIHPAVGTIVVVFLGHCSQTSLRSHTVLSAGKICQ